MHATVTLRTQDGELHQLGHGDIVGRLWSAALPLSSPHVSEAHAMVSLRGGHMHLLSLRGLFAYRGKPSKDLVLEPGQRILFARDVYVDIVEVSLPEVVIGIEGDGLARQPLPGVASLRLLPQPTVQPGARDGAVAVFWSTGDAWTVRTEAGEQPLVAVWSVPSRSSWTRPASPPPAPSVAWMPRSASRPTGTPSTSTAKVTRPSLSPGTLPAFSASSGWWARRSPGNTSLSSCGRTSLIAT